MRTLLRSTLSIAAVATSLVLASPKASAAPTKDECIDAHGRGQDLREEGRLTKARQTFLTCSQPSCPSLVQADCARFAEELGRLMPSLTFVARDAHAGDLPNTAVYLDEQLVASRLDEGKTYDVDPGKHAVRFVHDGKEVTMRVVVTQGEKGRNVIATFEGAAPTEPPRPIAPARTSPTAPPPPASPPPASPEPSRPLFPLVVAGIGGVALGAGAVLIAVGMGKIPSTCSNSTKECAAPPGDKSFDDAHSGVSTANLGVGVGIGGAAVLVTGLVWYFAQSPVSAPVRSGRLTPSPWIGKGSGGLGLSGVF